MRDKIRMLSPKPGHLFDGPVEVVGSERAASSYRRVGVRGDGLAA